MIGLAHIKARLGQYAALWVGAFLISGAAVLAGMLMTDFISAVDWVLPVMMGAVVLGLGAGVVASLLSREGPGTKMVVVLLALLLVLPLLWAPVSAAVAIAFFADRAIEYSSAYATFQIAVARVLYPVSEWLGSGDLFEWTWQAFQVVSSLVGFASALVKVWPMIRRLLSPEAEAA